MSKSTFFPLLFLAVIALPFCKDKQPSDPEPIHFQGITPVDENGQSLGTTDPDDWRLDDSWTTEEQLLFPTNFALPAAPVDTSIEIYPAYPNPCMNVFHCTFRNPYPAPSLTWNFRLVDEDFKVLAKFDSLDLAPGLNTLAFNLQTAPADTLRLYYSAIKGQRAFRGHGDVLKTN